MPPGWLPGTYSKGPDRVNVGQVEERFEQVLVVEVVVPVLRGGARVRCPAPVPCTRDRRTRALPRDADRRSRGRASAERRPLGTRDRPGRRRAVEAVAPDDELLPAAQLQPAPVVRERRLLSSMKALRPARRSPSPTAAAMRSAKGTRRSRSRSSSATRLPGGRRGPGAPIERCRLLRFEEAIVEGVRRDDPAALERGRDAGDALGETRRLAVHRAGR